MSNAAESMNTLSDRDRAGAGNRWPADGAERRTRRAPASRAKDEALADGGAEAIRSDSAFVVSRHAVSALRRHETGSAPDHPLDAATGIKNGLLLGAGFWAVAFVAFNLANWFA